MAERLGARKDGGFRAVSTAPSFNKTPVGSSTPPLPYPTVADLSNSVSVVPTVKFNDKPVYVLDQTTQPSCKGDNAGVAKGVKSGTVNGEVKPVKGSGTVRLGGKPAIREGDPCTMNGGNNPGIYVTTPAPAATAPATAGNTKPAPVPATVEEKSLFDTAADKVRELAQKYRDDVSGPVHDMAGDAMDKGGTVAAGGAAATAGGALLSGTGVGAVIGVPMAVGGVVATVSGGFVAAGGGVAEAGATGLDFAASVALDGKMPNLLSMGEALAQRVLMSKIEKLKKLIPGKKKREPAPAPAPAPAPHGGSGGGDGLRVEGSGSNGDCGIKAYKDQKCPPGQQAHHIIPDYALRYGSRGKGAKGEDRIPGMPSMADGPSICVTGQAKVPGSEHNAAHEGTDPKIAASGKRTNNGPNGLAPIGEIIEISIEEVSKVKPHCRDEIKRKVDDAFKGVDRNKFGRTTQQPPTKGGEAHTAAARGDKFGSTPNGRRK